MIALIGAGGHAKVVWEALRAVGVQPASISIRDGNHSLQGIEFLESLIETPEFPEQPKGLAFHVAIGCNSVRGSLIYQGREKGCILTSVIHPASLVSSSALVGAGTFIAAGAIVASSAVIDEGVIVNHSSVVDHDCRVGALSHIAPGSVLGGNVHIGSGVLVGSNSTLLPNLSVGDGAIIGAGSVVTKSVKAGQKWIGFHLSPKER